MWQDDTHNGSDVEPVQQVLIDLHGRRGDGGSVNTFLFFMIFRSRLVLRFEKISTVDTLTTLVAA